MSGGVEVNMKITLRFIRRPLAFMTSSLLSELSRREIMKASKYQVQVQVGTEHLHPPQHLRGEERGER